MKYYLKNEHIIVGTKFQEQDILFYGEEKNDRLRLKIIAARAKGGKWTKPKERTASREATATHLYKPTTKETALAIILAAK